MKTFDFFNCKVILAGSFITMPAIGFAGEANQDPLPKDNFPPPAPVTNSMQQSPLQVIATLTVYDEQNQIIYQENFDASNEVILPDWVTENSSYTWTITYSIPDQSGENQEMYMY